MRQLLSREAAEKAASDELYASLPILGDLPGSAMP